MERVTSIEFEDEDGNVVVLKVRRVFAADTQDLRSLRSKSLIVRPGGMVVASDEDMREITTADDAIADAEQRQRTEYALMRERGLSAARTGGEQTIQADQSRAPASRPRRGSAVIGAPMEVPNQDDGAAEAAASEAAAAEAAAAEAATAGKGKGKAGAAATAA